jgi:hypothetical protein
MTSTEQATLVIAGMLAMGQAVIALYFLKFWRRTHDRLFAFFALAFGILTVQRLALALGSDRIDPTWYYALRLLGFLLIVFAIIDKNRATDR